MFKGLLSLAAMLLPCWALAIDLGSLSVSDRRIACVAYGLIDIQMQVDGGQMDEATFQHERRQLVWKILSKGDNYSYARDVRRLDTFAAAIIEEQPPPDRFAAQVRTCRGFLRL